ncbi:lipocalin family protein [Undibacterium sp. TS12]|uniref:lipocalin family protein n=1 Tax=Undibacterium sp. TS12 TaxID=2908202 RepID=UPI001F4C6827|nr:lipocalin family protein [Undibacterium sp. TS12]MCH8618163.1 lipocalin family protein [Undibacterium sp. TS12]
MKNRVITAILYALSLNANAVDAQQTAVAPLVTIPTLDVPRYMGTWYELAKFENRFQKSCAGFTSATYSALPDGKVQVANRCQGGAGEVIEAIGEARQVGNTSSPKLKVRFAPAFLSFLPMVWGDYWVIDLDKDYQLAAVSEAKREFLWILSRTKKVDQEKYNALIARLAAQGLDVAKLVLTKQE